MEFMQTGSIKSIASKKVTSLVKALYVQSLIKQSSNLSVHLYYITSKILVSFAYILNIY